MSSAMMMTTFGGASDSTARRRASTPVVEQPLSMKTTNIKAAAINWLQSIPGGGGSCVKEGLVEGLLYANLSSADRKVLLYVGGTRRQLQSS